MQQSSAQPWVEHLYQLFQGSGSLEKNETEECNSWRMGRSAAERWALDIAWLLHAWTHSSCSELHKVCTRSAGQHSSMTGGRDPLGPTSKWGAISIYWLWGGGGMGEGDVLLWGMATSRLSLFQRCLHSHTHPWSTNCAQWLLENKSCLLEGGATVLGRGQWKGGFRLDIIGI